MFEQNKIKKIFSIIVIIVFVALPGFAESALLISNSDTLNNLTINSATNHLLKFRTLTGVDAASDTIIIKFPSGFNLGSVVLADIDLSHGAATGYETEETLAATPSAGAWGADISGQAITFTAPTNAATGEVVANDYIVVEIGTNAAGGTHQIINPSSVANYIVSIGGAFGDRGSLAIGIINNYSVGVSAIVPGNGCGSYGRGECATDPGTVIVNVNNFVAAPGAGAVALSWENPGSPNLAGVKIQRSFSGFPAGPSEGVTVFDGLSPSAYIDRNFTSADYNRTIYYTAFAYNTVGSHASGATASTIINSDTPPLSGTTTLAVAAQPEKRVPRQGNWRTRGSLDLREPGTDKATYNFTVETNSQGRGELTLQGMKFQNYDIAFKGISSLRRVEKNIPIIGDRQNSVDFTRGGTTYLLGGDCNPSQDNLVNSLDVSTQVGDLSTNEEVSDLNLDGIVNSLDVNILLNNLMKWGEK